MRPVPRSASAWAGRSSPWPGLVFVIGLPVTIVLMVRKVKGAILIGIVGTTILAIIVESIAKLGNSPNGWSLNVPKVPTTCFVVCAMFVFTRLLTTAREPWSRSGRRPVW